MSAPIWIRERDLQLDLPLVVELLRKAMKREAAGIARNMTKTHVDWGGGTLHAIGAVFTDSSRAGAKVWAHTPKGATPLEILWDAETGKLLAIIEAFAMGQLRTAGMAGLATDHLAQPNADLLAVCGTGRQALAQVAAIKAVRPIRMVRVYGRDEKRRAAFVARVRAELGLPAEGFAEIAAAVADAPIVTLVTRATEPFLTAGMPAHGAHINAMGAITPERQEFVPALLDRCAIVAVDSIEQARALASELKPFFREPETPPALRALNDVVAAEFHRPANADLTIFKSLGVGIADLSLAEDIYRIARERRVGVKLPVPAPAPVSFQHVIGG